MNALHAASLPWQMPITLACLTSWTLLLIFSFFTFLPYTLVAEPILRLLLQFDPDGKWVLTADEQRCYKHITTFVCLFALSIVLGIVTGFWLPVAVIMVLYIATMPLSYPAATDNLRVLWGAHLCGAGALACFIFIACKYGGNSHFAQTIVGVQCARFLLIPSLLKFTAGTSLVKLLVSAPALKGLAGIFGLGGAGALQALKEKEKQKARAKMLSGANSQAKGK
jgi:hypothetical protein